MKDREDFYMDIKKWRQLHVMLAILPKAMSNVSRTGKTPTSIFNICREYVGFKKGWKSFLKHLHFSLDVEDWSWCFSQFDSRCSLLLAVLLALCVTVSISSCPYKHPLCLSYTLVYFQSFIKFKFLRWNIWYIPRFAFGNTSSNAAFLGIKSWVSCGDIAERYQITSNFICYSQWISLKI